MSRARSVSQLVGANTALGNTVITGTASVSSTLGTNGSITVTTTGIPELKVRTTSTSGSRGANVTLQVDSTGGDDPAGAINFFTGLGQVGSIQATSGGSGATGQLYINLANTSNTVRQVMKIDTEGRMTLPYQPAIMLDGSLGSSASYSAGQNWNDFNVTSSRGGMSWNASNGRITVPVTGYYIVYAQLYMYSSSTGQYRMAITKNGSQVILSNSRQEFASAYETSGYISAMISCAANDYINLNVSYARTYYAGSQHNHMYVALVG